MRAYRSAWLTTCGISGVIGIAVAVLVFHPLVIVLLCLASVGLSSLLAEAAPPRDGRVLHRVARSVIVSAPALIGVCGLIAGFAELGWLWLVSLAVAGAPVGLMWWRDRDEQPEAVSKKPVSEATVESLVVSVIRETPTAAICWTWRRSYVALQQARQVDDRLRIVLLRQQCLDELAAREPSGFRSWLSAGARAASDPSRYVCPQRKTDA
jgi:hypothetical protein